MKKYLIIYFLFLIVLDANSQNSKLKIKALVDSTFNYIDTSNNAQKRFSNFSTQDSLFKIGIVYNNLRPQLIFQRFEHLTFNIFYQGKDENEFKDFSERLIKNLCGEINIENDSYGYDIVCADNLVDTYVYVDSERMHIHYENFVGNHTSPNIYKEQTYYNERSELKASIIKFSQPLRDSNLNSKANLRWSEIKITNYDDLLSLYIDEYLGEKNSAGYRKKIKTYKISIYNLISKMVQMNETDYQGRIIWEFSEDVVESVEYDSEGEIINTVNANNLSTICLNNSIKLNDDLFNFLKAYFLAVENK